MLVKFVSGLGSAVVEVLLKDGTTVQEGLDAVVKSFGDDPEGKAEKFVIEEGDATVIKIANRFEVCLDTVLENGDLVVLVAPIEGGAS